MDNNNKPKSIFYAISSALKGNKKDVVDAAETKDLLTNQPNNGNLDFHDFNNIQQKQQEYLDVQSQKIAQDIYSRSVYYDADRISSYNDYRAMDQSPEISVALDIMADESVTRNDSGDILSIYSDDSRIKKVLKQLFHQTLNVDFNLWFWTRELLKYGDNFLKLEVDQQLGVYDIIQLPTGEIHKELGVDGNPKSVRYKWDVNGMYFEDFEIAHFSLISDGTKLPYGRSVLDPARKLWKQLQLAEDAMLVYRLVRAPERRIFYLDIGNLDAADVKQYMEAMKRELKKQPVVDSRTGNVNFKFNPVTFEEDYFIPVRGGISSKIETLPGASNLSDIADIEYLQNKLFTAIKVPKTYLNYAEGLPGGSTLSQADLRFSRTINRIQEMIIMELRRIANIHLFILGFQDDLDNFTLTLTNPSTQQELLKLETMKARNDVFKEMFSSDATSPVSYAWAMENILGFSKADIKQILRQKKVERRMFFEIERAHIEYMDTGIFNELDKKFRRPDFDPNENVDPDGDGGSTGGGGADGGFGGGDSFSGGGLDGGLGGGLDAAGGEGDLGDFDAGDGSVDAGGPEGAELSGADEPKPEEADNLKETNTLLRKNKIFSFKTKTLLEGIEHYLGKIKDSDSNDKNNLIKD